MPKPFLCGHSYKFYLCLCGFGPASFPFSKHPPMFKNWNESVLLDSPYGT